MEKTWQKGGVQMKTKMYSSNKWLVHVFSFLPVGIELNYASIDNLEVDMRVFRERCVRLAVYK